MDSNTYKASYLANRFLMSKRCLKKVYGLNAHHRVMLLYVCAAIELTQNKSKKNYTKVYQSQISRYCFISLATVNRHFSHLIKKRLLTYSSTKKGALSVGKVLLTYVTKTYPQEVPQSDVGHRSTSERRRSDSSNFTNTGKTKSVDKKPKHRVATPRKVIDSGISDEQLIRNKIEIAKILQKLKPMYLN